VLTAALASDPIDYAALRALLVVPGAGREGYTDDLILKVAEGTLETLQRQQALARWRQVAELEAALPHPETAQRLARYEAQLDRQIHRAMRELREL